MRIEHVALYVKDLENTQKFFMKYLGAKSNDGYHNQKTGFCSYFLTFEDGARIEIMNIPEMADLPKKLARTGYSHIAFSVESMHERKKTMADLSDAVIALPGGCGTLEELLEIITWKQLGLYLNPIVILNVKNYFDPLLDMLRQAVDENFMRVQHGAIWHVAQTPQEAVELIYTTPLWDASIRKFAAI